MDCIVNATIVYRIIYNELLLLLLLLLLIIWIISFVMYHKVFLFLSSEVCSPLFIVVTF